MDKADNTKADKELQREMLHYYKMQNQRLLLEEQQNKDALQIRDKTQMELLKMSAKAKKLNDKLLVDTIYSIIIKKWEDEETIIDERINIFEVLEVQEWFLNKEIDLKTIGLDSANYSWRMAGTLNAEEPRSYFDLYGLKERIRWSKIILNIRKKLIEYRVVQERATFADIVDKLVKRARQDNLFSVSTAHIKQFASELGIDTSRQLSLLTNAVSTRLQKEFGGQEPKRTRTLTNSIKIEVFKRDNYICQECGASREAKLHVHHIIPFSRGGSDEMSNLITLCESCNEAIGNRIYEMKPKNVK